MKQRPILFSSDMIRAILAGRKMVTRRIMKPQPDALFPKSEIVPNKIWRGYDWAQRLKLPGEPEHLEIVKMFKCPYGQPGDVLWVREKMYQQWEDGVFYDADNAEWEGATDEGFAYRNGNCGIPSIHMPKSAVRIWLEITDVRVERVQDITVEQAIKEGIECPGNKPYGYKNYLGEGTGGTGFSFRTLWQKINGPDSWEANPFVWVVEFKRIEKPE